MDPKTGVRSCLTRFRLQNVFLVCVSVLQLNYFYHKLQFLCVEFTVLYGVPAGDDGGTAIRAYLNTLLNILFYPINSNK